jgi:hypothetical protein
MMSNISYGYYISEKTGKKYSKEEYINHGWGGIKLGFKDLPHDEYPYLIIDNKKEKPYWLK